LTNNPSLNEEIVEKVMQEILTIIFKSPPLEGLNGLMSAFSHLIYSGYRDKETRRGILKHIHDSALENIEIMEAVDPEGKEGGLKKNHPDGRVRKKYIF
jgi:hypothetical protein